MRLRKKAWAKPLLDNYTNRIVITKLDFLTNPIKDVFSNNNPLVLEIGTGSSAKPQYTTAAGKTATAQTGKYYIGSEICSGWFCGFFPFENPKYTVIVFSENTLIDTKSCAEIFSELADGITINGY